MPRNTAADLSRRPDGGRSIGLRRVPPVEELSIAERLELLSARPLLQNLDVSVLEDVASSMESVHVPGGARIVARKQSSVPLLLVVQGALRASFPGPDGRPGAASEYFRGSSLGESYVLSGRPSAFDVDALCDSHVLSLSSDRFDALMKRHPDLGQRFARAAAARLIDLVDTSENLAAFSDRTDRVPRSIALVTVGGDPVQRTRDLVASALSETRATTLLDASHARHAMGAGIEHHLEDPSHLSVLECDRTDPAWLDFCVRQTDRVMILVGAEEGPIAGEEVDWWRASGLEGCSAHVELAIVHEPRSELPHARSTFAGISELARLHHVRRSEASDGHRLARWLMDRPIGLVLGGGGAFGIAHVGVLKALEEARVPIDIVGGTSMGSIFAGAVALGWSADRIMAEVRTLFSKPFSLYDPTIPLSALLAGKKLDRILSKFFDDVPISALWLPFFSISTDLSHARPHVQDSGSLRDAVRASCSIPGVFPPLRVDGALHVDGGLVDNLPIDVMGARCHGPIIAVDVFAYDRPPPEPSKGPVRNLLRRLAPLADEEARLFDTLLHSTLVGSRHTTLEALATHPPALHLVPDLSKFRALEWRAYDALFDAGYTCARRALDAGALPRGLWEGRIED